VPFQTLKNKKRGFTLQGLDIVKVACKALDDKKAMDIKAIEVTEITVLADYFILATATSSTHVRALSDEVEDALTKQGLEPHHIEGRTTGWILLDYGTVVVHVFTPDQRELYSLEHLWGDAKEVDISAIITEE
jgi:ribosome-associated protein